MKATFKTAEEFLKDGFTRDYPNWYKGTKKDSDAEVRAHLIENLAGRSLEIIEVRDANHGVVTAMSGGQAYQLRTWMFRDAVLFRRLAKPKTFRGARFHGISFSFPCSMDHLSTKDAVRLAKWVLKVSKA